MANNDYSLLEDDSAGYLISISDMMSGLLFVFMLTLAAFVINFQDAATKAEATSTELSEAKTVAERAREAAEQVVDDLTNSRRLRAEMLQTIRDALIQRGIQVEVDEQHGVLRLTENAILFESGKAILKTDELHKLHLVAKVLGQVLPCYVVEPPPGPQCAAANAGKLEAVFIEGHTDNVPIGRGRFQDNWDLSAQRAMFSYRRMVENQRQLETLRNTQQQPIFSVSGYGAGRPVPGHAHAKPTNDPQNRRIDLRFIMTPPSAELAVIRKLTAEGAR